jgi:ribosomal protein L37AE/L43A
MRSASVYEPSANWIKVGDRKQNPTFPKYETTATKEEIWECSQCHTLIAVAWQLTAMAKLTEEKL